ncbi:proprotein convertase P-domain-containing protein [Aequorivita antarctica]|uniref:P/Homo B domain-containing protein n=1 Tax=Aequorivita antarctica TaxID=153266 RepID=A0A5C6YZA2_9FLAO|nr:proprotein convertase P-domain-containing protein [Aequorivita antarctica]TXD72521.1 hypothetical protein ESU54_11955 [Aequorivita antarctica]SRX75385.1 Leupeptin-inactivating enzyme 1 [Aequorivita antarctica]
MKNMYTPQRWAFLFCFLFFLFSFNGFAQVGIGTLTPESTLDVRAVNHNGAVTATDGILAPRVNSLAIGGSQDGQLVYLIADTGNFKKGFHYWTGSAWKPFSLYSSSGLAESVVAPDAVIPPPIASFTNSTSIGIPDGGFVDRTFNVSGISGNTTLVTILVNLTHPYDRDLWIDLIAPTGQILVLSAYNGGSGDNYTNTNFMDAATNNINTGTAPFTGNFIPQGVMAYPTSISALAGFNGLNPNGTWTLRVWDDYTPDAGIFNSAILSISGSTPSTWVSLGEVAINYLDDTAIIVQSTYSGDPVDLSGVKTALTRSTASVATGISAASLPGTILNYASASPSGTGNVWVNTFNQTRNIGLTNNTTYYYQLWRQGNIETPTASNETFSIVPMRIQQ